MALEKWIETRRVIAKEKSEWATSRELLNERIKLVQQEIESLKAKSAEADAGITEADGKRLELVEENEKLKSATGTLGGVLAKLETGTLQLVGRLPGPIRERIRPLSQRIPDGRQETKLSVSERFQSVIGVLNEVNKFNHEIVMSSEVRSLADGTSVEVVSLYIGLGQGYYVSANGKVAGIGTASKEGWVWKEANEAAPQIARAIAVLKNEQVASYIQLPLEVR